MSSKATDSNNPDQQNLPRGFHWLQVKEIRQETADASSIVFDVPTGLKNAFSFKQGQYLTLLKTFDREELRRPYSLCVSPAENQLRICSKKIPGGRMSGFLNDTLATGDWLPVMEPNGRFYRDIEPDSPHHYVGIAGGSGVTPVLSLLKTVLAEEPESIFTLLYGNRSTADIIFNEALNDLKNIYLDRLQVIHVLSKEVTDVELFHGLLDSERVERILAGLTDPLSIDCYFICGPGPMMEGARKALNRLNVDTEQIRIESFGSGTAIHAGALAATIEADNAYKVTANVKTGGVMATLTISAGVSVLDAALNAKLDLPYACKGGVCCTCKARLIEGTVEMAVNYGLEKDEIERGFILTCQAIPTSDSVTVDYDQ